MGERQGIRAKIRALRRVTTANGATPAEAATAAAKAVELERKYDLGPKPTTTSAFQSHSSRHEPTQRAAPRAAQRTASTPRQRPAPPPKRSRITGVFWTFLALILGIAMTPIVPGVVIPMAEERGWLSREKLNGWMADWREPFSAVELPRFADFELPSFFSNSCSSDVGKPVGAQHQGVPIRLRPNPCDNGVPTGAFHLGTEIKLRP